MLFELSWRSFQSSSEKFKLFQQYLDQITEGGEYPNLFKAS